MSEYKSFFRLIFWILFVFSANSYLLVEEYPWIGIVVIVLIFIVNVWCGFTDFTVPGFRLKICNHGIECIILFLVSLFPSGYCHFIFFLMRKFELWSVLTSITVCVIVHAILFINGIISVYCTSLQLGIKHRITAILCAPIPIIRLFVLENVVKIAIEEVRFESEKAFVNKRRKKREVCKTQYPILLVHGVFFRDYKYFNYWGRIPRELKTNGATVFYGEHQSARMVKDSAEELAQRIKNIVEETGCGKINIIAHSKGGLDCRYAIANLGVAPYIASLTTVCTPHRGCEFAEQLLNKAPKGFKKRVAFTYNFMLHRLGDKSPDFIAAVSDLTASACKKRNEELPPPPKSIYTQSVGSVQKHRTSGQFPLNLSYKIVEKFDGENDGLVGETSFNWGERYTLLRTTGLRGISHCDMTDLNRENIPGFDVREFYVGLVSELREKGL